jgi:hypothetical protein
MIPDLRFVIGAVMATALLGVTLFGLAAAMHISHQSKLSPLEASRLLAYYPETRYRVFDPPAPRFDSPFANIPADPNPVPMQQPAAPAEAPAQTAAVAQPVPITDGPPAAAVTDARPAPATEPMPDVQPANLPSPSDDPDTVDERAVINPPLPLDTDPPAAAEMAPAVVLPAAVTVAPVESAPASPAPIAEQAAVPPDVPQLASIPTTTEAAEAAETRSDPPAAVAAEADAEAQPKAKRKRTARKAAKRPARRPQAQADAFGFPVNTTPTANRPAQGFWGPFN